MLLDRDSVTMAGQLVWSLCGWRCH